MENDTHWSLDKKQIIAIATFILLLVAIPLSFSLAKQTQVFKSKASGPNTNNKSSTVSTEGKQSKEVPAQSPLSELKKQLEKGGTPSGKLPTPTPSSRLSFGPTLIIKIALEGRPANNQAAKVFIGIAEGAATSKPQYLLTFSVDIPASGIYEGLSLAGLTSGTTYTAYIKGPGQIDSSSTFNMSPSESKINNNQVITLLSGDLNEDNVINTTDYTLAQSSYGATSTSPKWNDRADFNADKTINNLDLSFITKNLGKTGASGVWFSPPPIASGSALPAGLPDGSQGRQDSLDPQGSTPSEGYESSGDASNSKGYWMWVPK